MKRFERPVLTVILRLVGDPTLAEDLAQETFLKAFRHLDRFDTERRFASWLFTIAHNTTLDYLRRRKPILVPLNPHGEPTPEDGGQAVPAPAAEAPDLADAGGELWAAVGLALENLRPAYRQILELRFREGLAYDEICDVTGLPMGTVKIHLHRARKHLAEQLKTLGFTMPTVGRGRSKPATPRSVVDETRHTAPA
jgi:RNA polymerase sigma-70 factor (ECF subfamily)